MIIAFVALLMMSTPASAYQSVRLTINDGIADGPLKKQIEVAASTLITELNRAQERDTASLNLSPAYVSPEAQDGINKLWRNEHFQCVESEIVERLLTTRDGYQVRGIPLIVNAASSNSELGYQEAVINFDRQGIITSFYYTIAPELYSRLRIGQMSDSRHSVQDTQDRLMILDYVEHFRTAYNQKDLKFLRQVFSDDALIITGKVVQVRRSEVVPTGNRIVYTTQTKQQYLENLARAFRAASYINVAFDDILIVNHPTIKDVYGVTVHQKWHTNRYSDEGYVFMVWDFRNPDAPQIHVRTWQPEYIDRANGQRLNPNDVFTLGDFDL